MLSVVMGVRNRSDFRVENCLKTLRNQKGRQTWQPDSKFIIMSDLGSDDEHRKRLVRLSEKYGVDYKYYAYKELWNRSLGLNLGIKRATTEYVLCTDVDMLFAPNFIEVVKQHLHQDSIIMCRPHTLPQDEIDESVDVLNDFDKLKAKSKLMGECAMGPCQAVSRGWITRVGGFEEDYKGWGVEDNDLALRAERDGLKRVWIHDHTSIIHQGHPKPIPHPVMAEWHKKNMQLWEKRKVAAPVVRNPNGWGLLNG